MRLLVISLKFNPPPPKGNFWIRYCTYTRPYQRAFACLLSICMIIWLLQKTEERSVPIAVRIHQRLELTDDKFYVITCGKAGFKNAKNETSLVSLKLLEKGKKVHEVVYGRAYTLRADISRPDGRAERQTLDRPYLAEIGTYGIQVKSCFAFNKSNISFPLINTRGCPLSSVISPFKYNEKLGAADATLQSMFRFPDSNEVHFQCDIAICKGL
ncbi:hypothetical protein J437_LFUL008838 [Ladona fulva]|uniref:ZP domain-containing protein n=1 Tax=Ladona fulva TaxID=123851 RepID=A0A8K0P1K7_LADFU|nr:hypothetical protein J437_LFUL008838 [Ladona fulva]